MLSQPKHPLERGQLSVNRRVCSPFLLARIDIPGNQSARHVNGPHHGKERLEMQLPTCFGIVKRPPIIDAVLAEKIVCQFVNADAFDMQPWECTRDEFRDALF